MSKLCTTVNVPARCILLNTAFNNKSRFSPNVFPAFLISVVTNRPTKVAVNSLDYKCASLKNQFVYNTDYVSILVMENKSAETNLTIQPKLLSYLRIQQLSNDLQYILQTRLTVIVSMYSHLSRRDG